MEMAGTDLRMLRTLMVILGVNGGSADGVAQYREREAALLKAARIEVEQPEITDQQLSNLQSRLLRKKQKVQNDKDSNSD